MNLLAALFPPPRVERRYVVATRAEDKAAREKRTETTLQLAVYSAVVPLETRRAETRAYWEKMRGT